MNEIKKKFETKNGRVTRKNSSRLANVYPTLGPAVAGINFTVIHANLKTKMSSESINTPEASEVQNVSDFVIKRLASWGITRIFGYPGDGINGIMGALSRSMEGIKFTQVRHEEMAALMACAHAKFTGEVGVCLATSGPGAIHLLN
jgi:hypothetical protein